MDVQDVTHVYWIVGFGIAICTLVYVSDKLMIGTLLRQILDKMLKNSPPAQQARVQVALPDGKVL